MRDLNLPSGVEAALDGDVTVAAVAEPKVAAAAEAAAPAAPEVIKEKKPADSK